MLRAFPRARHDLVHRCRASSWKDTPIAPFKPWQRAYISHSSINTREEADDFEVLLARHSAFVRGNDPPRFEVLSSGKKQLRREKASKVVSPVRRIASSSNDPPVTSKQSVSRSDVLPRRLRSSRRKALAARLSAVKTLQRPASSRARSPLTPEQVIQIFTAANERAIKSVMPGERESMTTEQWSRACARRRARALDLEEAAARRSPIISAGRTGAHNDPDNATKSESSQSSNVKLSERVRVAMRDVAHPIAAVIAQECGMLVSSFNTVTLEPVPFVSFNIKDPSNTLDQILRKRSFFLRVLWSSVVAEKLRHPHDGGGQIELPTDLRRDLKAGSLFVLGCFLHSLVRVGDHYVVVGKVWYFEDEQSPNMANEKTEPSRDVLLWRRGMWHEARPRLDSSTDIEAARQENSTIPIEIPSKINAGGLQTQDIDGVTSSKFVKQEMQENSARPDVNGVESHDSTEKTITSSNKDVSAQECPGAIRLARQFPTEPANESERQAFMADPSLVPVIQSIKHLGEIILVERQQAQTVSKKGRLKDKWDRLISLKLSLLSLATYKVQPFRTCSQIDTGLESAYLELLFGDSLAREKIRAEVMCHLRNAWVDIEKLSVRYQAHLQKVRQYVQAVDLEELFHVPSDPVTLKPRWIMKTLVDKASSVNTGEVEQDSQMGTSESQEDCDLGSKEKEELDLNQDAERDDHSSTMTEASQLGNKQEQDSPAEENLATGPRTKESSEIS